MKLRLITTRSRKSCGRSQTNGTGWKSFPTATRAFSRVIFRYTTRVLAHNRCVRPTSRTISKTKKKQKVDRKEKQSLRLSNHKSIGLYQLAETVHRFTVSSRRGANTFGRLPSPGRRKNTANKQRSKHNALALGLTTLSACARCLPKIDLFPLVASRVAPPPPAPVVCVCVRMGRR